MRIISLVFDLDGVILDSEAVKLHAFESLFSDHVAELPRIRAYNESQRGIPRETKFRFICQHILESADADSLVHRLMGNYKQALDTALAGVSLIPGIKAFLQKTSYPKYICSSAPMYEIVAAVRRHGIEHHFQALYGYPDRKAEVLTRLKQQCDHPIVFFGDAEADHDAAKAAGVSFILVEGSKGLQPLNGESVPTIQDFRDHGTIEKIIAAVSRQSRLTTRTT